MATRPDAAGALLTDLYQLTMLQGYFDHGMRESAVFELFIRRLPRTRNFALAAGLEQALEYLESLRFYPSDIERLRETRLFGDAFLEWLAQLRFTGDVHAAPEGTVIFANEPILRVTAPIAEAQLVESRLLNVVHFQTLIATKAARCVLAARGRPLVDFGMRRAHGAEAAILAARASYLAGFAGTSNVIAKPLFGVPVFGTMAHSFVQAHDSEAAAFARFAESQRGPLVLLIDTYDTEAAARCVVDLARCVGPKAVHSVRIDSGDLGLLARRVRAIFDMAGLHGIQIFASGNLDEDKVEALVAGLAPIDGFGIGTSVGVSDDAPALDCVYKLQEYAGRPRRKLSHGKATWPGRKQIFRHYTRSGELERDVVTVEGDTQPGTPLLRAVMRGGRRTQPPESLDTIRQRTQEQLDRLPAALRSLEHPAQYPVEFSSALHALAERCNEDLQ